MRYIVWAIVLVCTAVAAVGQDSDGSIPSAEKRFYRNTLLVKNLFVDGDHEAARQAAIGLLQEAEAFPKDWNYGNAIHAANIVLGRIALKEDDPKSAGKYLTAAGNTPGSPQLDTFGPDMNLARELLIVGEIDAVQRYFDLCAKFWKMDDGRLKQWKHLAGNGTIPDFGPNLRYFAPARQD